MKNFLKKLAEMAAVAIVPVIINAVMDLLADLKKKIEDEA